ALTRDIFEFRRFVGRELARLAALRATPDDLAALTGIARAAADPALINSDPYGEGWLFRVAVSDEGPLLSAEEYAAANNAEL
ncbi:MAG: FCD domain-containing protein, partial [Actinobacteria bacterium]|nr:FCD domain-containing protein [Actinomycetota bacterium]